MKAPKILKVIYMGQPLKNIYAHATRWEVIKYRFAKLVRKAIIATFLLGAGYGIFMTGRITTEPVQVEAIKEITVEVSKKAPVMNRIADCESGDRDKNGKAIKGSARHIDPKTGQVFTKANTNKTVDIGKYMVNEFYHGKDASKLGLDLTKEEDNEKMAYYIYETQGTGPWEASKSCWQ